MKSYAYNIRHNYGKEGKRADYSPYSCQKIILGAGPGHGEYHGCPYKEYDSLNLTNMLRKMKIDEGSISDIVESARTKNYQLACRKQFEARHKGMGDGVGNHPNAYFEAVQTLRGDSASKANKGDFGGAKKETYRGEYIFNCRRFYCLGSGLYAIYILVTTH